MIDQKVECGWHDKFDRIDAALVSWMSANGIHLLRWAVAIVYVWFGGLKLINRLDAVLWPGVPPGDAA